MSPPQRLAPSPTLAPTTPINPTEATTVAVLAFLLTTTQAPTGPTSSANFHHPDGEVGIDPKHKRIVKFVGRVGFMAKAIIYGVLGGLLLRVAAGHGNVDSSPQGVFLLVGDNPVGIPLLIALAACIALYCTWRWWEAFTGQGSDAEYSKKKNFFRYRVSPFVSGAVYAAYDYYVIRTILTAPSERTTESGSETTRSSFPDSWASSGVAGKIGVGFLGCLFLVATLTQWQVVAMGSFKRELYQDKLKRKWLRWLVHGLGYIGFLARGFLFLLVSVLLFRTLANSGGAEFADKQHSITGKAILTMSEEWWGRTILCLVGIGLCLYACFAALNTVFKIYPTPPNSRKPAVDEDKAKEEQEKASSDATEINRQR
ncbi:uncharacterized protein EV422DRAFT_395168 [Fimicolochytrium jonesii]|uniref:uncharacterized protein n=1 Tax=Fimicolochytrium jonesii TaxID=1396493 RepID=UPI0022FEA63D|nr:uncharacterized protein EV422DRAFT_395168 [Fimicolochytrium jonesii]KAI8823186.1 hypothetical protein EV422DRAFT_395168 [Fimicolochytrium jonesii]